MATLIVPPLDLQFPTLGPALADFIEERCVYGPGSLAGRPAVLDKEKRAALYRLYEVFPAGHALAGRRRFQRGAIEWRKGMAKTEFAAWIAFCELHPEAPVRGDGFDAHGNPVGRPVDFPYIPMMAVSEQQVSELAYGVLKYVVEQGPDADLFDASMERIMRLGSRGQDDGKAVPVSAAPGSRDGALTTFQHFDEPHRLYLARARDTHETMLQNLPKRPLEDPWALYTSTAGASGQNSIEEDLRHEAEDIDRGLVEDPSLFFFARWAGEEHDDLSTVDKRVAAVAEATGPVGELGPGQFLRIAKDYDRKGMDKAYWERVYLNRWRSGGSQAFNITAMRENGLLVPGQRIARGRRVTVGFDGARRRDSTGFVITDVETGLQELVGAWEQPDRILTPAQAADWEVPEDEVNQTLEWIMSEWDVLLFYGDPPYWTDTMGKWAGEYDVVEEWWTNRHKVMAYSIRAFVEATETAAVAFGGSEERHEDLVRHLGNSGKQELRILDDQGQPLWVIGKVDGKLENKMDFAMCSVLSWQACLDARKGGALKKKNTNVMTVPLRVR